MNDFWLFLIVVLTLGGVIKCFVTVFKRISIHKTIQSVEEEIRNLFDLFEYAPDQFLERLQVYYHDAYCAELDLIVYGKDMMPDINGTVRLRIEYGNADADSIKQTKFLRITVRGIHQLRQAIYERIDNAVGFMRISASR